MIRGMRLPRRSYPSTRRSYSSTQRSYFSTPVLLQTNRTINTQSDSVSVSDGPSVNGPSVSGSNGPSTVPSASDFASTGSSLNQKKKLTLADIRTSLRPALKPRGLRTIDDEKSNEDFKILNYDGSTNDLKLYDPVVIKKDFLYSKEGNFYPEYGFTNSLEIASPIDIYKTIKIDDKF